MRKFEARGPRAEEISLARKMWEDDLRMAVAFHVYVEGAVDHTSQGLDALAQAIANAYGLPAAEIAKRMAAGRFRVKSNVDRATADQYRSSLEALGAIVTVGEATPTQPVPVTPAAVPPSASASAPSHRPSSPALPPRQTPSGGSPVARPTPPPAAGGSGASAKSFTSGLSAAFGAASGSAQTPSSPDAGGSLGALSSEGGDSMLSLASLDGSDGGSPAVAAPSASGPIAASFGPPPEPKPAPVATPASKSAPVDLFAPPDAEELEAMVALADDEVEAKAAKKAAAKAAAAAEPPTSARLAPSSKRTSQPIDAVVVSTAGADMPRGRFAAGVLLAVMIGFVPAHFVHTFREDKAFEKIDAEIVSTQANVATPEAYAALESFRAKQIERKESERRSLAIVSMLIWAAAGAGIGYVWFRRIPWDKPRPAGA